MRTTKQERAKHILARLSDQGLRIVLLALLDGKSLLQALLIGQSYK